ncbi:hypothetical protein [Kitasatospora sp. NPDC098663]|uniref:hypothetical protein n=1 Tax=Kitasatospora sp. NPDC098663 TaxID=3364096 RepID=UPI0038151E08
MKVLTHNVMFLSWLTQKSEGDWDNAARSRLIAESAYVADHDVLVFQELFDPGPSEELMQGLEGRGYRHSPDFHDVLGFGNLQEAGPRTGWKYSFDTIANDAALHRHPADPAEDTDRVLLRKGHAPPCDAWTSEVLKTASPSWETGGRAFTDYSDHYPVTAGR